MGLAESLKAAWQYMGQIPAGAAEGTVADSHIKSDETLKARTERARIAQMASGVPIVGPAAAYIMSNTDYRPALVDQPGAMYGVIKSLITGAPANESLVRANTASERTNKALGVEDPHNAAQAAMRIGGSLVIPGPKIPAVAAATRLGRVVKNAPRIAAELALPMRQTGIKTAVKTVVPVGVALREGVNAIAPDGKYHGILSNPVNEFDGISAPAGDEFDGIGQPQSASEFSDILSPPPIVNADEHHLSTVEKGIVGAAVLGAAALATSVGRAAVSKMRGAGAEAGELAGAKTVSPRPLDLAPDNAFKSIIPKPVRQGMAKLNAAVAQHDAPIRNAANDFLTPEQAAETGYKLDTVIPQALGAKVKNAFMTGQMPGTSVQVKPLAPLLDAIANELSPTERQMLGDGLLAKSALNDINNSTTGIQAAFNDKTPVELQQMADLVANDPKLSKYADAVRDQYKGLLDYKLQTGFITQQEYNDLRAARPDYVHMSRDVTRRSGPEMLFSGLAPSKTDDMLRRGVEEGSGVQAGAVRDPIDTLTEQYTKSIHAADANDVKRDILGKLANSRAASTGVPTNDGSFIPLIKKLDAEPKDMTGVHTVYEGGRPVYYKIGDPALDRSLQFNPRATMPVLGQMRQITQFFTTGLGNVNAVFGASVSPVYDTMTGLVFRPAGKDLGLINEAINKAGLTNAPLQTIISYLDPSSYLAAPIGALRSVLDELTGSMANSLSSQLMRDHSLILDTLGPQKTTALRDMLKSRYDSSIRAMLDAGGAASHFGYGADSSSVVPTDLAHVAPDYYKQMSSRAAMLASKGMWNDLGSFYNGVLANSKNAFVQAMPETLSKMYTGLIRNMQEGFKYQYAATNLPKSRALGQLDELMSSTRRISSDPGQYGGSNAWNRIADSVMYTNVGVQALAGFAQAVAKDPKTVTLNLLTTIGALAAFRYGGMISDPDVAEKVKNRTDGQDATVVTGPGGIDVPIEPGLAPIVGPLFGYIDSLAMDQNGNFDPDFVNAIFNYYDKAHTELRDERLKDSFWAGLQRVNPVAPSGIPGLNAALAATGIDPGMSRVTGQPMELRVQDRDPMAGEGKTTDSAITAQWGAILDSAIGAGVTNYINMADQAQRAYYAQNGNGKRGTSVSGAVKVGLSQFIDDAARTKGPVQSMLFSDYEKVNSVANTDFQLYQNKRDGIDKATEIFGNAKHPYTTSSDPRVAMKRPLDLVPQKLWGTPLAVIGAQALDLEKDLHGMEKVGAQYTDQMKTVQNQKTTTIENRNEQINEIVKKRQHLYSLMLLRTQQAEDSIGKFLKDDHFTFQNFDLEKYMQPSQQQAPQGTQPEQAPQ